MFSVSGKTRVALWISQVALVVKNPPANARDVRDMGSTPELGRFPEEGHGNLLQYSFLEKSMDRGAWWAPVQELAESDTTESLTQQLAVQKTQRPGLGIGICSGGQSCGPKP